MKVSDQERADIKQAIAICDRWGFGNIIAHLAAEWMIAMDNQGCGENARETPVGKCAMHPQMHRDIMDRGEWDHTGEAYE